MVKIWQFWEFEHSSNKIVRVIDVPSGLELFASDVFQVIAPELNEKVILLGIKYRQRHVLSNQKYILVNTLNALAIHGLIGVVEADVIRKFMQWVRSNIMPVFKRNEENLFPQKYLFQQIDYQQEYSLRNYLHWQGEFKWAEEITNYYSNFIYKKNPLPAVFIQDNSNQVLLWRNQYLGLMKNIFHQTINSYEKLYQMMVVSPANLLLAQEVDLYIFSSLREKEDCNLLNVMNQGLVIQALESIFTALEDSEYIQDIKNFYLELLEYFSEEIISEEIRDWIE
ncbi:hypothetical protein H6G36_30135 [Anabaena minutissima FACHB-250]|nr:hypothetical protein [Anabaena minutissima FACHB-250]